MEDLFIDNNPEWSISSIYNKFENAEFCFQFDNEEPVAFAWGPGDLKITISPTTDGCTVFTDKNGKTFKIFARPHITE
jgi:hypothetical protein